MIKLVLTLTEPADPILELLVRSTLLSLLILVVWSGHSAADTSLPENWPVVFTEVFRLEVDEIRQIPLTWDDIHARSFYLRLHATRSFDATVTRVEDGSIVFSGHLEPNYGVLIPWGRDEYAHLTLWSRWQDALQITMTMATDPAVEGLEVYSLQLNRFLSLYDQGRMKEAERALSRALVENPDDEIAQLLWGRLWEERGVGSAPRESPSAEDPERQQYLLQERQRLRLLEAEVDVTLATADVDSARRILEATPEFAGEEARTGRIILTARVSVADGEYGAASSLLQDALRKTGAITNRFEIYRELAGINRDLGNNHQLDRIIEQALSETSDPDLSQEAESWRL